MVDLQLQYEAHKEAIDNAIFKVLNKTDFINGEDVKLFAGELADFVLADHVITCANGTDALQLALMALELPAKAEIIVPSFCYVAAAEAAALLGYKVVFADVLENTFNIDPASLERLITENTKVVIPVHLFGQSSDMLPILKIAQKYNLYIIEDNAQSLGAVYHFPDGVSKYAGTIGHIGTTSFFPSKNLSCMGDGGAVFTNDENLAKKLKMLANHGQEQKYKHDIIGINSRLDTLQAAVLREKLKHLKQYNYARLKAATIYTELLKENKNLVTPFISKNGTHVFHQYTLKIKGDQRNKLKESLEANHIPSMVYYPVPLHKQPAFSENVRVHHPVSEKLCEEVLALPMHPYLEQEQILYICEKINKYLK